jgi:hypothetical protein
MYRAKVANTCTDDPLATCGVFWYSEAKKMNKLNYTKV